MLTLMKTFAPSCSFSRAIHSWNAGVMTSETGAMRWATRLVLAKLADIRGHIDRAWVKDRLVHGLLD